jgi:hypothetical protein
MASLFLSYTLYDRDLVERLEHALTSAGHTVFVDRGTVAAGSSWAETIRDEIEKADVFVVIVSRDSLSRDSAVGAEVGAAWGRRKRIVAVEVSDVSVADSLRLPRSDYEIVSAKGLSDSELAAAILEKARTDATSAAS